MSMQPAVAAQLNWFANHPDFLERTFGRAELWLYYIVGQLEQRDMPRELALLPVIESAFEPYAYSRARASGLWQFISDTGRRFGLKQDWWYDGRRDPIEATRAALDYLQALHDEFNGDWLLAIAAYNCGELAVSRAIERNQRAGKPTDFWHLKLPAETRGYVPELLAMRRLVANPARYGLEFSRIVNEPYFVPISTGGQIDLQVVANIAGISTEDLYTLNPAFHRWATDPTGPHRLLVPIDSAEGLEQTLAQLTPEQRMRIEHYTVQRGDTVATIARRFATKPEVIRELNELGSNDRLVIETALRVPSSNVVLPEKAARAAMLFDSPVRLRRHRGVRPDIRVVRRGDTLYGIAQRLGTDVQTLAAANGLRPGDRLHAGQKLRVASSTPVAYSSSAAGKSAYRDQRLGAARWQRATAPPRVCTGASRRHALQHCPIAAGHGHRPGWVEPHVGRPQHQAWTDAGRLRPITHAERRGNPCGQARADRRRRHRAIDRLGHRRGHARPGRRTGLLLRQRQAAGAGRAARHTRSARSC